MAAVDHALAHAAGHDRRVEHLGDPGDVGARALSAAADHDQRPLRTAQQLGGALDAVFVDRAGIGLRGRRRQHDRCLARPGIHRAFEGDGPAPAGQEAAESLVDQSRRLGRCGDAVGPLGQAAHDRELVGQLVQQPDIAADHRLLDLAGEGQHRRVHRIGGRQRRRRVQEAGPGNHYVGRRLAARHRIAERHVGAGLFVTGMYRPDRIGPVVQCVEERIVLHAGQAEQGVDAIELQHRHDSLGSGQGLHPASLHARQTP